MKKKVIIILSFLFFYFQSNSQNNKINNFSINGKITDSITNNVLPYVNIALLSVKDSVFVKTSISNNKGVFQINNLDTNSYILRIDYFGYSPILKKINFDNDFLFNIKLIKIDTELEEVTITAEKEIYKLETDKRIYLTANDESIQNAFAEDALENAPGVYFDIDGNLIIRDKHANIWINGKPAKKDYEDLLAYLKLLPASRIEKIEVITNPSARYTATNVNSIVNIVLKKDIYKNSLFAVGSTFVTDYTFGIWATAYITKKNFDFNIYIFGANSSTVSSSYDKSFNLVNKDTLFYVEYSDIDILKRTAGRLYTEYTYHISNKTDINISAYYYNFLYVNSYDTEIIRRYNMPYQKVANKINNIKGYYFNTTWNFNHRFNKKGHEIDFEVKSYKGLRTIKYYKHESYKHSNNDFFQQSTPNKDFSSIYILSNYKYPINKKKVFSIGFHFYPLNKETFRNIVDTLSNTNMIWNKNLTFSSEYILSTPSYEVYSTFSGEFSLIKYKFGLRYEKNIYDLEQTVPIYNIYKVYSNLYPSVHFSYSSKSKHNFSLSYSRRVNTPIKNLNPYIDRTNNDYISSGNPYLDFAATDSYEFSYFKRFKNINVSTSIYHQNTKNDIIKVSEPVFDYYYDKTVVLQTYANCADSKFTGTEISLSSSPLKNLKLRIYTNTYYQNLIGSYNNLILTNKSFIYNVKLNISYYFFNKFLVTISPYYLSDNSDIFQNIKSNFYTNASLKFNLFNKKISFDIRGKDIFGSKSKISEYYLSNFYHYSEKDYKFQHVRFIVIYRIGNSKFDKQAKINKLAR